MTTLNLALAPEAAGDFRATVEAARRDGTGGAGAGWYAVGTTAVVPLAGVLDHSAHAPSLGVTSYQMFGRAFDEALADSETTSVLVHVNSPGGDVQGLFALADRVAAARGTKPTVAVVDEKAMSAAYAVASACDKITLASGTAQVGSVGVVAAHMDVSAAEAAAGIKVTFIAAGDRKTDASPHQPLSDEARASIERDVVKLYGEFVGRVATNRGLSEKAVRAQEAAVYRGQDAIDAGLADAIASPEQVLGLLQQTSEDFDMNLRNLSGAQPGAAAGAGDGDGQDDPNRILTVQDVEALGRSYGLGADQMMALVKGSVGQRPYKPVHDAVAEAAVHRQETAEQISTIRPMSADAGVTAGLGGKPIGGGYTGGPAVAGSGQATGRTMATDAGAALQARIDPSQQLEAGNRFQGASLSDVARQCLSANGYSATYSGPQAISAAMGTSDFVGVLADFTRRELHRGFNRAPAELKKIYSEATAKDFRAKQSIMAGDFPTLLKVAENGEFHYGSMGEQSQTYSIATFGRVLSLTRQALINDDLGAFSQMSLKIGQAARELENSILADVLVSNPLLADGETLFSTEHGNTPAAGAAISIEALAEARAAMRKQKSVDGEQYLNIAPRYLVVGADDELAAQKLLAQINPTTAGESNPFAGQLELVVDPRIDGNGWFLASEPSAVPTLEFSYLEGARGLDIQEEIGFDIDALKIRARLDFGAGPVDWRGVFWNPGA